MMITAMGIGMRCIELVGNLLVFGLIFGYLSAERRRWLIAGIVGALAVTFPVILPNWVFTLRLTTLLLYAAVFVFFEKVQVGLILAFYLAKCSLRNLCMGILTAMVAFPVRTIEGWYQASLVNSCILLLIFAVAAVLLRSYRESIHNQVKKIQFRYYLIMSIVLSFPLYTYYTSSTLEQDVLRMEGILTIVDGIIGLMLTGLIILIVILYFKEKELKQKTELNERCIEEQTEQYRLLNEKQLEMKKFRHDSKAHLSAIYALSKDEEAVQVQKYVSQLIDMEEGMKHFDTGNIIGDAVINQYYGLGLKDDIKVKLVGTLAEEFTVPETDFCVILTNAVSNAYEAARRCTEHRLVEIIFTHYRGTQFVIVRNSSPDCPEIEDGRICPGYTSKPEKEFHGFGIQSIRDAVERNGGLVRWSSEPHGNQYQVTVEIQFPLTE